MSDQTQLDSNEQNNITVDFMFESKFIKIKNADIHYVDVGEGDPILFLHGVPASNYVWRNIIPTMSKHARCIAPDLIGMGKSGKPDIDYRIFDHIEYINEFIKALNLKNVTLVLHGLGSIIGFNYLGNFSDNVKGVAFYESHFLPVKQQNLLSVPAQHLMQMLNNRDPGCNPIIEENYLIQNLLPTLTLRNLHPEEQKNYAEPFAKKEYRKPLLQYFQDLKLQTIDSDVASLMEQNLSGLQQNNIPKLLMYNIPGFYTTIDMIKWCRQNLTNLQLIDLGDGHNLAQETNPLVFATALEKWFLESVKN